MPGRWDEFAADELRVLLAESRAAASGCWTGRGTWRRGCRGRWRRSGRGGCGSPRSTIIADATAQLDDGEARAAEEQVLDRANRLTRAGCGTRSPGR